MKYLIKSDNEKVSGTNDTAVFSAISEVKNSGGLYISYVGGEENSPQETSTAQGWASALCGKWMKSPWKNGIDWSLDNDYPTVLKLLSQKVLRLRLMQFGLFILTTLTKMKLPLPNKIT